MISTLRHKLVVVLKIYRGGLVLQKGVQIAVLAPPAVFFSVVNALLVEKFSLCLVVLFGRVFEG